MPRYLKSKFAGFVSAVHTKREKTGHRLENLHISHENEQEWCVADFRFLFWHWPVFLASRSAVTVVGFICAFSKRIGLNFAGVDKKPASNDQNLLSLNHRQNQSASIMDHLANILHPTTYVNANLIKSTNLLALHCTITLHFH